MMVTGILKYIINVKVLMVFAGVIFLTGCSHLSIPVDFSKPVKITRLSEQAWIVDIGKALDRPSRYKLSRVEAAKAARRTGCEYFKADPLLNEQLSTFKGQRAYRCVTEDSQSVFVTKEILQLETL